MKMLNFNPRFNIL